MSLVILLVVINILAVWHEPLLIGLARRFRTEDPPASSDAIVLLLGSAGDRSPKAAELYRNGLAPILLMGRAERTLNGKTEDDNRRVLRSEGVPDEAIRILPGAAVTSTYDEARRVRDYARTFPLRRITVVTTAFHSARARWTFDRVFQGSGIEIRLAPSDFSAFTEKDWYTREDGIKLYLGEALRTLYYRVAY